MVILSLSRQVENSQGARVKMAAVLELVMPTSQKPCIEHLRQNSSFPEKLNQSSCPLSHIFGWQLFE